jgi:hypothetical protein
VSVIWQSLDKTVLVFPLVALLLCQPLMTNASTCSLIITSVILSRLEFGVKYGVREAIFDSLKIVVQTLPQVFIFTQFMGPQTRLIKHIAALEYFAPMYHLLCSQSSFSSVGGTSEMRVRVNIKEVVFQCDMQH